MEMIGHLTTVGKSLQMHLMEIDNFNPFHAEVDLFFIKKGVGVRSGIARADLETKKDAYLRTTGKHTEP